MKCKRHNPPQQNNPSQSETGFLCLKKPPRDNQDTNISASNTNPKKPPHASGSGILRMPWAKTSKTLHHLSAIKPPLGQSKKPKPRTTRTTAQNPNHCVTVRACSACLAQNTNPNTLPPIRLGKSHPWEIQKKGRPKTSGQPQSKKPAPT